MSNPQKRYQKPAKTPAQLSAHLAGKGLTIIDQPKFELAIERIGYFRLLIYMRDYQDPATKRFTAGSTSDQILQLYNFDRELRLLCLDVDGDLDPRLSGECEDLRNTSYR